MSEKERTYTLITAFTLEGTDYEIGREIKGNPPNFVIYKIGKASTVVDSYHGSSLESLVHGLIALVNQNMKVDEGEKETNSSRLDKVLYYLANQREKMVDNMVEEFRRHE